MSARSVVISLFHFWCYLCLLAFNFCQLCYEVKSLSHVRLFATLKTAARQAPLSTGFSRQEYWSGLTFPSPGGLLDPGIEPECLMSPALAGRFFSTSATSLTELQLCAGAAPRVSNKAGVVQYSHHGGGCCCCSRVWPCAIPETAAHQAPLSTGFSTGTLFFSCSLL